MKTSFITEYQPKHESLEINEIFKNLESKIEQMSLNKISSLIETVQHSIKNNHIRLMSLSASHLSGKLDVDRLRHDIEQENKYLAGTILPLLYKQTGVTE